MRCAVSISWPGSTSYSYITVGTAPSLMDAVIPPALYTSPVFINHQNETSTLHYTSHSAFCGFRQVSKCQPYKLRHTWPRLSHAIRPEQLQSYSGRSESILVLLRPGAAQWDHALRSFRLSQYLH